MVCPGKKVSAIKERQRGRGEAINTDKCTKATANEKKNMRAIFIRGVIFVNSFWETVAHRVAFQFEYFNC